MRRHHYKRPESLPPPEYDFAAEACLVSAILDGEMVHGDLAAPFFADNSNVDWLYSKKREPIPLPEWPRSLFDALRAIDKSIAGVPRVRPLSEKELYERRRANPVIAPELYSSREEYNRAYYEKYRVFNKTSRTEKRKYEKEQEEWALVTEEQQDAAEMVRERAAALPKVTAEEAAKAPVVQPDVALLKVLRRIFRNGKEVHYGVACTAVCEAKLSWAAAEPVLAPYKGYEHQFGYYFYCPPWAQMAAA